MGLGHCMGRFCPSCIRLLYSLRKSTEFHVKRTECQRILLLAIAKRCPLSYALHDHSCCPLSYSLHIHSPIVPRSLPSQIMLQFTLQVYRAICASTSSPPLNFRASTYCFFSATPMVPTYSYVGYFRRICDENKNGEFDV